MNRNTIIGLAGAYAIVVVTSAVIGGIAGFRSDQAVEWFLGAGGLAAVGYPIVFAAYLVPPAIRAARASRTAENGG